ncbi:glycoside hydrolase family 2 TIM barrel-domain containing protein [Coprobacter tertius]|uniref:Beta-galactosidase n=1 Tax=Coprobacter tertius TaxID=2944915 RepID=A0ABT1MJX4_9BACT|nr:glycoside hydrolase family 2 TIM barrel-domain containing protein [Coprobacter tertius]MCP9612736.1 discoidin domain-containing protein [Coprobacter tertius]
MKTTLQRYRKWLLICLLCTPTHSFGQEIWNGTEWNDVSVTQIGKEESCTVGIPFSSEDDLQTKSIEESPYFISLNGVWKFHWAKDPAAKVTDFYRMDFNDADWDNIDVPSVWQVYGVRNNKNWDKPLYVNTSYPFTYNSETYKIQESPRSDFTYNNNMKNPIGSYRREFTIPEEWDGREIYVRFNGAGPGYYLWVNEHQVGYSEDSYLPSEFKITDYVKKDETNVIAVQVYRFSSGSFLECQDFWRLSGISRDVFLWSAPKTQIRDYFFQADLDELYTDATVTLDVKLEGPALSSATLSAKIMQGTTIIAQEELESPSIGVNTLKMNVSAPDKWSAETPNLYDLVITLKDGENVLDIRGNKVGFRKIEVGNKGELLINGKRMVFHGVNRHDHSEENGRTVSKEEMENDIKMMKRLNINAVRTSHYPNNPYFYDLCDKYGLYVLAEANIECHGNMGLSDVLIFRKPMVERNQNHVKRFRNHPSIFMWSYGNESGGGNNFQYVEQAIKALDKTRLTHYQGNSQWSDVTSSMYSSVDWIKSVGESRLNESKPRPHIHCENSHAMGNAMGNVRDYFDLYEKYPSLTGEFIWDWKDQGLKMPVPNSKDEFYWAYGGDFGDNPNDGTFCTNGVIFADYTLSAKSYNTKKIYQPIDFAIKEDGKTFVLKSKLAFKSTEDLDIYYSIYEDGKKLKTEKLDIIIPAGETKEITIENALPSDAKPEAEYFIRFNAYQKNQTWWADANYEVAGEQIRLKGAVKPIYQVQENNQLTVEENSITIKVHGPNFTAVFSKLNGSLNSYTFNEQQIINKPLALNLFRLPTENDKEQTWRWDDIGLRNLSVKNISCSFEETDNAVDLNFVNTYSGKSPNTFKTQVLFKVMSDGTIFVSSVIDPTVKNSILPRIGFRLEMPKEFENLTWFGRGPWESYNDRKEACFEGVYNSTVTEQWEKYVLPQETGNKEDVRWMSLTDNSGSGLLFIASGNMSASATHFRPEDIYINRNNRSKHPYEAKKKFCENTVIYLNAEMRALGNASCGPDVLEKYELKSKKTNFNFIILPVSGNPDNDKLSEMARIALPICAPVTIERDKQGKIKLTTTTPDARIYFSKDEEEFQLYEAPFELLAGGNIRAYCEADAYSKSITTSEDFYLLVDKSDWKVISYSSQENGNDATKAIDDDADTFWHTRWSGTAPKPPHEIVVDMKDTYRIEKFIYQGRGDDNDHGRIKEYEIYFSNDPKAWGSSAAKGEFENNTAIQYVPITSKPTARYFKLIVKSEAYDREWAAAAELGIEASEIVDPITTKLQEIKKDEKYYIKHVMSGLYLQRLPDKTAKYEGDFCINPLDKTDDRFIFDFTPINGFTSYYNVRVNNYFINQNDNWRCVSGALKDKNGQIQIEMLENNTCKLRGVWQTWNYINLDRTTSGSYIYADKSSGAIWKIEEIEDPSDIQVNEISGISVYPTLSKGTVNVKSPVECIINVQDISGQILAIYKSTGNTTLELNYPAGIYFITVNTGTKNVYKIILQH